MAYKAPGKHFRKGLSTREFYQMFDEEKAQQWFIEQRWPNGIACPSCGSLNVNTKAKHKTMPFRCRETVCRKHFSVKMGTFMQSSPLDLLDWLYVIYLVTTNLKSVSSMKLRREIKVTQKTAWYLAHRIRRALGRQTKPLFSGPVEVDETYVGGRRRNMSATKRKALADTGRGPVGKMAVVGVKDRTTNKIQAQVVDDTTSATLQGFITSNTIPGARIYTDDATAYTDLPNHESVKHSVMEYVRGQVHTNGIESFWSMLKRAHKGTFHRLSPKHLHRYVDEFVARHNMRELDTLQQMSMVAKGMEGSRLRYKDLVRNSLAEDAN